jgi:hypothetical protein
MRLSDDRPHAREAAWVTLEGDAHPGVCRLRLVAVAPRGDPERALEALVNGSTAVYRADGSVRRTAASPRMGFLVRLRRTGPATWRGVIRFPRAGAWHLVVPNWCAPGIASPRPFDRVVAVRA